MILRHKLLAGVAAAATFAAGTSMLPSDPYQVVVALPSATNLYPGAVVQVSGLDAGKVDAIWVSGSEARLRLDLDKSVAPLHDGAQVRVAWNSLVGRRQVDIVDGPATSPTLPDGKLIAAAYENVELDDVLATLDAPTRAKVQALVGDLDTVLGKNDVKVNQLLAAAAPGVQSIAGILDDVGSDGQALRSLVTNLHQVTSTLSSRDQQLSATVSHLRSVLASTVRQQQALSAALDAAPSTLAYGTAFFSKVPAAVDQVVPLVDELRPAIDQLPEVAHRLNPVLTDLRPTVADLRPTLAAASSLLGVTPNFLDRGTSVVPQLDSAVSSLQPAVSFLRPYTPEVIGFLTNWTSLFSAKNSAGHFGRALVPASGTSLNSNPGILPPGQTQWQAPAPGQLVGQAWTDANGDTIR